MLPMGDLPPRCTELDIARRFDSDETYVQCAECGAHTCEPEIIETFDGIERAFCRVHCWQAFVQRAQDEE